MNPKISIHWTEPKEEIKGKAALRCLPIQTTVLWENDQILRNEWKPDGEL